MAINWYIKLMTLTLGANTTITNVVAKALANIVVPPSSAITHLDAGSTGTTPTGGEIVGGGTSPGVTPTPAPHGGGSGNAGSSSGETILVSAITISGNNNATEVVNGGTLQMSASLTPSNASNKDVTWEVATLAGGTAWISSFQNTLYYNPLL